MKYTHEDGTPFTKEEFLQKLKTDKEFNDEFGNKGIDQIANLINDLKTDPNSRRLMVNAWNVTELDSMVLPPCHYGFQVYTRELSSQERKNIYDKSPYAKDIFPTDENGWNSLFDDCNIPTRALSLMWSQRSVDTFLGLPFNIASYGLLLCILAELTNMIPDQLIGSLGDVHLYENHIDQAQEQLKRTPLALPKLRINTEFWPTESGECGVGSLVGNIDWLTRGMEIDDFQIEGYESHPAIKAPLSN